MAEGMDRSNLFIGVVAVLMLAGGGWMVVKHYQTRKAEEGFREAVAEIAARWTEARGCLTNAAPGIDEDPAALRRRMARARDRSMALDPADDRYPYRCFSAARAATDALWALEDDADAEALRDDIFLDDGSTGRPFGSNRLSALVELALGIERDIEALWQGHGGEGSPFPADVPLPQAWDERVLPPFPETEDCVPTAVRLDIGVDEPRSTTVRLDDEPVSIHATDRPGELAANERRFALETADEIERVRACSATDADGSTFVHVLAGSANRVVWVLLDGDLTPLSQRAFGDEALATAFRGEDGREVHVACDRGGPTLAYASGEGSRIFVCGGGGAGCESAPTQPVGIPRLGLARLAGRSVVLSYPPQSRVAVIDVYEGASPLGERWVVPTIDDRGDPELTTGGGSFVLRLCGAELHADPNQMEWR